MSINKYYPIEKPVKEGKIRFVIEYEGFGVRFLTDIDEVDETCARAYFKKFYPSAKFISITKKKLKTPDKK